MTQHRTGPSTVEPPKVSIIVPVFNGEAYVHQLFEQLDRMPSGKLEVILYDDGSEDRTFEACQEYASLREHVIVESGQVNLGAGCARNSALRRARGEYVWFADSDDEWSPNIVHDLLEAATRLNADVVISGAEAVSETAEHIAWIDRVTRRRSVSGSEALHALLRGSISGYLWNKLFRRSLLGETPFPDTRTHEDLVAVAKVLPRSLVVASLPGTRYWHVRRPGSLMNRNVSYVGSHIDCYNAVLKVVRRSEIGGRRIDHSLLAFKYRFRYLGVASAISSNSGSDSSARRALDEVFDVSELTPLLVIQPKVAVRSMLVKLASTPSPSWLRRSPHDAPKTRAE